MSRIKKRMSKKQGLPPGTLMHIGGESKSVVDLYHFEYDGSFLEEKSLNSLETINKTKDSSKVNWLNVNGVANTELIAAIGEKFDIHHLLLEDIVNTAQRPKVDEFSGYLYLTVKMLSCDRAKLSIAEEQVSMLLVDNWVITFQERAGDVFDPIRSRIRQSRGKVRAGDSSYLFYALLDCIVDNYFHVVEILEERIDDLNEVVGSNPDKATLRQIHEVKSEVNFLKRVTWPVRDMMFSLLQNDSELISSVTMPYLRDVDDHVKQILDAVADAREGVASLFDLYASTIGNNMNQIMKVLTIMSAVFIPMTFIAGIYGMNFEYIPELSFRYGYFTALSAMFMIAVIMLALFKMKKWW